MHSFSHQVHAIDQAAVFAQAMARQVNNDDLVGFTKPAAKVFPYFAWFKETMKQDYFRPFTGNLKIEFLPFEVYEILQLKKIFK